MPLTDKQITAEDIRTHGMALVPTYPQLKTPDMQERFDELVREVVAPKLNGVITDLTSAAGASQIGLSATGVLASNVSAGMAVLQQEIEELAIGAGNVVPGGAAGQIYRKISDVDFDAEWITPENNGINHYGHSKVANVHYLVLDGGGDNIKFIATTDYTAGDTFDINGTEVTGQTITGGNLITGFFISGATVQCIRSGNYLYFDSWAGCG